LFHSPIIVFKEINITTINRRDKFHTVPSDINITTELFLDIPGVAPATLRLIQLTSSWNLSLLLQWTHGTSRPHTFNIYIYCKYRDISNIKINNINIKIKRWPNTQTKTITG